jgi:hypothetical protein
VENSSLDITSTITIEAWINRFNKSGYNRIVGKTRTTAYAVRVDNSTGAIELAANFGGTAQDNLWSTGTISQGTWGHAVVTYDGTTIRYYIDGAAAGTATPSPNGALGTNDDSLNIGSESSGSYNFPGIIDEVRISNTARTFDWIKTSYTNQNNPGNIDSPGFYTVGNEDYPAPTAIDLISFTATGYDDTVQVEWETAQEINNLGFNLYRSAESNGSYTKLNKQLIPGLISAVSGQQYIYSDKDGCERCTARCVLTGMVTAYLTTM